MQCVGGSARPIAYLAYLYKFSFESVIRMDPVYLHVPMICCLDKGEIIMLIINENPYFRPNSIIF